MFKKRRFFFVILFFCFSNYIFSENVVNGFLEIKDSSLVNLKGNWEFYWEKFYFLEDIQKIEKKDYCFVPHNWIPCNAQRSGQGFATYYVKIKIPEHWINRNIGLYIPTIGTSYKIFINGQLVEEVGKVAPSKNEQIPLYGSRFFLWKADRLEQHILIHVSNFYHKSGGLWYNLSFGLEREILNLFYKNLFFDLSLFGAILIMALFHLGLFFQKSILNYKDEHRTSYVTKQSLSILYFSIFCFLLSVRVLFVNNYLIYRIIPESYINWFLFVRIEYWTHILGLLFATLFFLSSFEYSWNPKILWLTVVGTIYFFLETIFGSTILFTSHLIYYEIFLIFIITYLTYLVFFNTIKKVSGALESFIGGLILYFSVINDILHARSIIQTAYISSFGLFLFILLHSFMISRIFEISFINFKLFINNLKQENMFLKKFFPLSLIRLLGISEDLEKIPSKTIKKRITIVQIYLTKNISTSFNDKIQQIIALSAKYEGVLEKYDSEKLTFLFSEDHFDLLNYLEDLSNLMMILFPKENEYCCVIDNDWVFFDPMNLKNQFTFNIFISNNELLNKIFLFSKSLNIKFILTESIIEKYSLLKKLHELRFIKSLFYNNQYINIWEYYGNEPQEIKVLKNNHKELYNQAIKEYNQKHFYHSCEIFYRLYNTTEDLVYLYYLNQIFLDLSNLRPLKDSLIGKTYFKYVVGHPLIDFHHQQLIQIILEIHLIDSEKIMDLFHLLEIYAKVHFSTEECLMKFMNYQQLEEHINEHKAFFTSIEYFKNQFQDKENPPELLIKFSDYLSKWLAEHISFSDIQGYGKLLSEEHKKVFSNWIDS
jgi:hemerythrin-like metal-binding protein